MSGLCVFLASRKAHYLTGRTFHVDGGSTISS
ncbi:hypothetical protein [Weissella jogaejeotgali]